jgi:hypothetical protein
VVIPLPSLAASDLSVAEFLTTEINRDFDLRADWRRLAEQGLLVLFFDDLDQVPSTARVLLQTRIASFSARYPLVPWMLTVRDPSVLSGNAEAELVELLPLDDGDIVRFVERLQHVLPTVDKWAFINRLRMYPDLHQLARIPLCCWRRCARRATFRPRARG